MEKKKIIGIAVVGTLVALGLLSRMVIRKSYAYSANDFPDNNFYRCIVDAYNKENNDNLSYDTELSSEQLDTITYLTCQYVSDTKGIEYLTSLNTLNIYNVEKMNLGNNKELEQLYIHKDRLENLDLSNNTNLEILHIYDGQLKSLDLINQTNLTDLYVNNSAIEVLDISNSSKLTYLKVLNSMLKDIKFPNVNAYKNFALDGNYIEQITVPSLTKIENPLASLGVQYTNQLSVSYDEDKMILPSGKYKFYLNNKIVIPNKEDIGLFLTNLGLENLTAKVYRDGNEVLAGNVINGDALHIYDGEKEIQNLIIKVFSNDLFEDENLYRCVIDQYNGANQTDLTMEDILSEEELKSLSRLVCAGYKKEKSEKIYNTSGIEKLTGLKELRLTDQYLIEINMSNLSSLEYLYLAGNKLTELNVSNNKNLKALDIGFWSIASYDYHNHSISMNGSSLGNHLSSIDVSMLPSLSELYITNNRFSDINLASNAMLKVFDASSNNLSSVDLSNNVLLGEIDVSNNLIKDFNIQNNLNIAKLAVSSNQLEKLDVSHLKKLLTLEASRNYISSINVKNSKDLLWLIMDYNKLSTIDLSNNSKLNKLDISYNNITNVDLQNNLELVYLGLMSLPIDNIDISNHLNLNEIRIADTNISDLSVDHLPKLKNLWIRNSKIKTINVTNNYLLANIYMDKTQALEYNIGSEVNKYTLKFNNLTDIISTGDKVLYAGTEYNVIVRGDLTGDGQLRINDVSKAYQALQGKTQLSDLEAIAVDVTRESEFKINDIAKMYQYIKEKISVI